MRAMPWPPESMKRSFPEIMQDFMHPGAEFGGAERVGSGRFRRGFFVWWPRGGLRRELETGH